MSVPAASPPPRPDASLRIGGAKSNVDITIDGHILLLRDMMQAVRDGREPMIPPEDARKAVDVICKIYRSSRAGAPVAF